MNIIIYLLILTNIISVIGLVPVPIPVQVPSVEIISEDCKNINNFFENQTGKFHQNFPKCCGKKEEDYYITCENGNITEIVLRFDYDEIDNKIDFSNFPIFKQVRKISLETDMFLNNELPSIFFENPNLKILEINNSNLKIIPLNLNPSCPIEEINLYNNSLKGFPSQFLNYPSLKKLELSLNEDIKEIPRNINKLTNLNELYLQNTGLTSLPDELFSLSNLTDFDIDRNPKLNAKIRRFGNSVKTCDFRYTNIICYEPGTCKNFCTGESDGDYREFISEDEISYAKCTEEMLNNEYKPRDSFFDNKILLIIFICVGLVLSILCIILIIHSYRKGNSKGDMDHDIYISPIIIKREPISVVNENGNTSNTPSTSVMSSPSNDNNYNFQVVNNDINSRISISSYNSLSSLSTPNSIIPLHNRKGSAQSNYMLPSPSDSKHSIYPLATSNETESTISNQSPKFKHNSINNKHSVIPIQKLNGNHIPEQSLSETNRRSYVLRVPSNSKNTKRTIVHSSNELYLPSALKQMEAISSSSNKEVNEDDKNNLPSYSESVGESLNTPIIIYQINSPINDNINNNIINNNSNDNEINIDDNNNNSNNSNINNKNNNENNQNKDNDETKKNIINNDNYSINKNNQNKIINNNVTIIYNTNTNEIVNSSIANSIIQLQTYNKINCSNSKDDIKDPLPSYSELDITPSDSNKVNNLKLPSCSRNENIDDSNSDITSMKNLDNSDEQQTNKSKNEENSNDNINK